VLSKGDTAVARRLATCCTRLIRRSARATPRWWCWTPTRGVRLHARRARPCSPLRYGTLAEHRRDLWLRRGLFLLDTRQRRSSTTRRPERVREPPFKIVPTAVRRLGQLATSQSTARSTLLRVVSAYSNDGTQEFPGMTIDMPPPDAKNRGNADHNSVNVSSRGAAHRRGQPSRSLPTPDQGRRGDYHLGPARLPSTRPRESSTSHAHGGVLGKRRGGRERISRERNASMRFLGSKLL